MLQKRQREELSRQNAHERARIANEELRAFFAQLNPLDKLLLTDSSKLTSEEWRHLMRPDVSQAWNRLNERRQEYHAILSRDPTAWQQYLRRQTRESALFLEWLWFKRLRRRGRKLKAPTETEGFHLLHEVEALGKHLAPAVAVGRNLKRAGGYEADDDRIAARLRETGCSQDEVTAVLASRTTHGAATQLVSLRTGKPARSVAAAVSKCRSLLRASNKRSVTDN